MGRIIGHGIDLVEVSRIARMIEDHGEHFLNRTFSHEERAEKKASPDKLAEHYAVRFACKEAVVKALGTGFSQGIALTEISVRNEPGGRPNVTLTGRCLELAAEAGVDRWDVSLTHTAGFAMASAIASRR